MTIDVAIIGGGIIGCSAAAMLAARGASVALFEASAIGAGASGRNLGALQHPFDPVLAPLFHDSLDRYRDLADDSPGFELPDVAAGLLLLNADARAAQHQTDRLSRTIPELRPRFLDPAAVAEAEPSLAPGLAASRLETGFPIPPASATASWAALARRRGVELRIGQSAQPWIDGRRARGARLEDGQLVAASAVLVAAGPWSPHLVDRTGVWQPIRRTWGVTVQLVLGSEVPRHIIEEEEVDAANRPLAAEAIAAGADEAEPPSLFSLASAAGVSTLGSTFLPAEPDPRRVGRLLIERGRRFVPALSSAPVGEVRICARPQSRDGRPFIGPVPGVDGLHVCAGHGPWGMSTGPASAALVVAAILDGEVPPDALRADRSID